MANFKIGLNQINKPAPQQYRNFSNAMIIFILPGFAAVVSGWGLKEITVTHCLLLTTFAAALIKGVGTILGNGQYYTSDPKNADDQSVVVKDQAADKK